VLNTRPCSWHALLATTGCEAQEEAQGTTRHPSVTGKGKAGRAKDLNLCKPRKPYLRKMECDSEGQDPPLGGGSDGRSEDVGHESTTVPGYEETPDTGRILPVRNMETPSRFGGPDQPPIGRPRGKQNPVAGTGRPRSEWRQSKGNRKAKAHDRTLRPRSPLYNWPHTRRACLGPKGS
jgi:hypothetical protein